METIAALFPRLEDADQVVKELQSHGYEKENLGVLAPDIAVESESLKAVSAEEAASSSAKGAAAGGVTGGVIGLLIGTGSILIPGVGPAFAAGTFSAIAGMTAGSGAVGSAIGGILGAAAKIQVPQESAKIIEDGIRRGGVIVSVQLEDDQVAEVRSMLSEAGAIDLENLDETWDEEVWTRFERIDPAG